MTGTAVALLFYFIVVDAADWRGKRVIHTPSIDEQISIDASTRLILGE